LLEKTEFLSEGCEPQMTALDCLNIGEVSANLAQVRSRSAVAIDCMSAETCATLSNLADQLQYRKARPVTGSVKTPVYQDFELDYEVPREHPFWRIAEALQSVFGPLLDGFRSEARSDSDTNFSLNDLIVQRYPPGCAGISPHRDHVEYRMIILIVLLSGDGDFRIHPERDEDEGAIIDFQPGQLLMMGAPGIASNFVRPFHSVRNITAMRRTIGMRFDRRLAGLST
tara:strand:- start:21 stop:701 length:681 start_codon:yes stop_codon:yes gene_type:complete